MLLQIKQDALSAKGYVYGYIGSVILVVICLALIMFFADTPKEALLYTKNFILIQRELGGLDSLNNTFKHLPQFGEVKRPITKRFSIAEFKKYFQKS